MKPQKENLLTSRRLFFLPLYSKFTRSRFYPFNMLPRCTWHSPVTLQDPGVQESAGVNNKFKNCPPRMDDGRHFTDYRSSGRVEEHLQEINSIKTSYQYRQYLTENAVNIMKSNRAMVSSVNGCPSAPSSAQTYNWLSSSVVQPVVDCGCNKSS